MLLDSKHYIQSIMKGLKAKSVALNLQNVYPTFALIKTSKNSYHKYYMNALKKFCKECDVKLKMVDILNDNKEEAIQIIDKLNSDFNIHGIILETPDEELANNIIPFKDLDCLSIPNVGSLMTKDDITQPCIAKGIFSMLTQDNVDLKHSRVLLINDDTNKHYMKYIYEMFRREKATIIVANSHTRNLSSLLYDSNIILIANNKINSIGYELLQDVNNNIEDYLIHNVHKTYSYVIDLNIHKNSMNELNGNVQYNNIDEMYKYEYLNYIKLLPVGEYINLGLCGLLDNVLKCASIQNVMLKRTHSLL
jgi:methylenetetrahydrofolate dehydrogenase (NADP+)/methenyltetrahydrofolate cyclohydrolase